MIKVIVEIIMMKVIDEIIIMAIIKKKGITLSVLTTFGSFLLIVMVIQQ